MSRSIALAHIVRHDDRTATGVWAGYTLMSAFQPIFAFRGGKLDVAAFEGLIRPFRDGAGVSPAEFFNAIPAGDRMHVETLTRTLHLLNAGPFLPYPALLFVNFDPSVFAERKLTEAALRDMRLTLHEAGIDPGRIVCEVTEKRSTSEQALLAFVGALRDHGFRIAVDDYGAEESDMERVAALRPDIVKFDAQWIPRLMETRPGFALLRVMVQEFASRGIGIVFEGIEEHWQLDLAERAGADMVQGYVLARPELAPECFTDFKPSVGTAYAAIAQAAGEGPDLPTPGRPGGAQRTFGRRRTG